jgi:cyclophilin family peptidyl-prolyl cis-trans isomerase
MKKLILPLLLLALAAPALAGDYAVIATNLGEIKIELYPAKAPVSVKNFLAYAGSGHYEGTIFHRVVRGFVIQGGGLTAELKPKPTQAPIRNEAGNGLRNERGTIAMARGGAVDSATCQFYINLVDNPALDHRDESPAGFGYAVFGKVVAGMDVVDRIGNAPTRAQNAVFRDVPVETVVIKSVRHVTK